MSVVIETTIGDITVDLYFEERPNTCLNFLKLCKIKYYNLCVFYKIEKNFIAQTGDPSSTGRGGESIFCHLYGDQAKYFDAEFKPRLKHEKIGTLSMVNNGNNMNGSQFFLTLSENLTYLDGNHTVFGEVVEGFDVLQKLNEAICDGNNRPYQDIRITHTVILHDPFDDPKDLEIPDRSPEPTKEMLDSDYIRADEDIDDNKGKTAEEIEEKIKESEAKARATILEMVGDIPDADVKPPENVLFVCKLNPVTTSEDLEIIFSRFGKILSCEVIKDKKSGDSLQYAFIEFEKEEDCEAAYFKMDNVLIDDRRIHVDFSQSVSKMNFEKDKLLKSKPLKSNISLKETDKKDGYNLIFDMDNDVSPKETYRKLKSSREVSKHEKSIKINRHSSYSEETGHKKVPVYDRRQGDNYRSSEHYSKHRSSGKQSKYDSISPDSFSEEKEHKKRDLVYDRRQSGKYHSPKSYSKHSSLRKKSHYSSVSPDDDDQRKLHNRYKERSPHGSFSSKVRHVETSSPHASSTKSKKSSMSDNKREKNQASSYRNKKDAPGRVHSSERKKKTKSTSSSDSDSSSSSSSYDYKHKEKSYHSKLELLNSKHKQKHKKRKYSN